MGMEDNAMMDVMMSEATATLYGIEHEKIVKDNFDGLYELLVSSLKDEAFRKHVESLKPRGMVTKGIPLKPENDAICFAKKLWFSIQRTSSDYRTDWYYVSVGVNLREDDMNLVGYNKVWLARVAGGSLDMIMEKVCADGFKERVCKQLADHIYKTYYEFMNDMLSPDADKKKYFTL
jgi:hypothetical protein